jgi:restriction endonuclease S subunit
MSESISIMSSVSNFKSAVIRIRDILRGPSKQKGHSPISGMESMRHICLYLMSRYITKDKASSLGVPDEFAWETIIEKARKEKSGLQYALDSFYHPDSDNLVLHFDRLFGTQGFSFKVKDLTKHSEILEILDSVNMEHVDCQIDILGWVYEQHLKTGSSSAGRDLGQFFTDRFICEYMVDLCKPRLKSSGVPESVCDPTMGTGGFLTSFIKFYKKNYPEQVDWTIQTKQIHGCDNDNCVAGLSRMNLFMESGGHRSDNLHTHDSLYGDLMQTGYDTILANMPFGIKNIKHADCCERVKALKINGTKSEPLFLQLMMVSLNPGGRCAVVVPDGMLVNSSACHDGTRKYLLDHFELKRVIKMRGQFFMNTGIQPSILFFENTGNPTVAVEFWDVVKGSDGLINETMVLSVPRERFDASCSLDMRRYQEVKEVANSAGFPMVKLKDLFETPSIKKRYTNKDSSTTGIPFYNGCYNSPLSCINTNEPSYSSPGEYLIMIKDGGGDHNSPTVGLGRTFIVSGDVCVASQNVVLVPTSEFILKYVYYTLSMKIKELRDLSKKSINLEHLSIHSIMDFSISLPPLAIQHEIVATLDRIYAPGTTELTETLKLTNQAMDLVLAQPSGATLEPIVEAQRLMRKSAQMVADVKAQMVAIVKSVGNRGFPMVKLGDIAIHENGKTLSSAEKLEGGEYDVMGGGMTYNGKTNKYNRDGNTISVSKSGASAGFIAFHSKKYWAGDCLTFIPRDTTCIIHYLYYYMKLNSHLTMSTTSGSTIPHCKWDDIKSIQVPLPPIAFQHALIARLDALQSQLTALETLQRQSEDNARFILESYLGSTVAPDYVAHLSEVESSHEKEIDYDEYKEEQDDKSAKAASA